MKKPSKANQLRLVQNVVRNLTNNNLSGVAGGKILCNGSQQGDACLGASKCAQNTGANVTCGASLPPGPTGLGNFTANPSDDC